jgi:hypothetical protein
MKLSEDTRPCATPGCGHEGRVHDHYNLFTYCGKTGCGCRKWKRSYSWNTGFIGIVIAVSEGAGGRVRYTTWLRLWLQELWIETTEQPMMLVPHPHRPESLGPNGGYRCTRCGSFSARVQHKGIQQAERIRRQFA